MRLEIISISNKPSKSDEETLNFYLKQISSIVNINIENIKPIQGDGGARVIVPGRLYDIVSPFSERNLYNSWGKIWR